MKRTGNSNKEKDISSVRKIDVAEISSRVGTGQFSVQSYSQENINGSSGPIQMSRAANKMQAVRVRREYTFTYTFQNCLFTLLFVFFFSGIYSRQIESQQVMTMGRQLVRSICHKINRNSLPTVWDMGVKYKYCVIFIRFCKKKNIPIFLLNVMQMFGNISINL